MSPRDRHSHFAELAAGYAIYSLEPEDEAAFQAHLPACAECREAVEQYRATAGLLAYDVEPGEPSPELRNRLLDAIGHDASRPPIPVQIDELSARRAQRTDRHVARRPVRPGGLPVRLLGAAASATLLLGGGALLAIEHHDATSAHQQLAARSAAMDALLQPGAKVFQLHSTSAASGFAVADGRTVYLAVNGLPRNDTRATTYVLWAIQDGTPKAVRTFDVRTGAETFLTATDTSATSASGFAVSYEPGRVPPIAPTLKVLG